MPFVTRRRLSRRLLLRGVGVGLSLPWLDAMIPAFAQPLEAEPPRRFVSVSHGLGLYAPHLIPERAGSDYEPPEYLKLLNDLLGDLTIVSGASHPGVSTGHQAEASILTAAPTTGAGLATFRNSISLDQAMAERLGAATRFSSLTLNPFGPGSVSYTSGGARIPAESSPAALFNLLFADDSPQQRDVQGARMRQGRSVMDLVGAEAKALELELGPADRVRLDDYFSSVRALEGRLAVSQEWAGRPKPAVPGGMSTPINQASPLDRRRAMFDLMKLALETDSTRFITLHLGGTGRETFPIEGVTDTHHSLSHHGKDLDKIAQLTLIESDLIRGWGDFLRTLKATADGPATLLDRTMVMLTSNLGNASSHDNRNMPVLLAGGGFRHGKHLAFDRQNNHPLPNLYVQMMQRLGLEDRAFSTTSTGESLPGLEMIG